LELVNVEVLAKELEFPEGPVAMADGSVVAVEIGGGTLVRFGLDGDVERVSVGGAPIGAAVGPDGAIYVCNAGNHPGGEPMAAAIQRVDPVTWEVTALYTDCDGTALSGPNDVVFDSSGNFWFTDTFNQTIHYASPDGGSIRRVLEGLRKPNGIGLSSGGDVLYWTETDLRQIRRIKLQGPGEVVPMPLYDLATLFADGPAPDPWTLVVGLPGAEHLDGMAVEEDGRICAAAVMEGGVVVVEPDDGSWEKYTLPASLHDPAVTNICFGGEDMRTAYLTCATTGRLVSCTWPRPGLRLAFP
jgi:gluconolactonase